MKSDCSICDCLHMKAREHGGVGRKPLQLYLSIEQRWLQSSCGTGKQRWLQSGDSCVDRGEGWSRVLRSRDECVTEPMPLPKPVRDWRVAQVHYDDITPSAAHNTRAGVCETGGGVECGL